MDQYTLDSAFNSSHNDTIMKQAKKKPESKYSILCISMSFVRIKYKYISYIYM